MVVSCGTLDTNMETYTLDCEGIGDTVEVFRKYNLVKYDPRESVINLAEIYVYGREVPLGIF